jgi:hypothetical protein
VQITKLGDIRAMPHKPADIGQKPEMRNAAGFPKSRTVILNSGTTAQLLSAPR